MSDQRMFSAKEETIHEIFSEKRYAVPYYQRPYSWLKENAESLWEDLYTAWNEDDGGSGYFLGSVVLVRANQDDREEIVDGQQRFITLQLLLAALAHSLKDQSNARKLLRYCISEEDEFANTKAEVVVKVGQRYHLHFDKILNNNSINAEQHLDQRFLENYSYFKECSEKLSQDQITSFGKFILQKAFIAVLRADDQLRALRIFSILNDRGVDLHPVDIIKARILEKTKLNEARKIEYSNKWEEYEERLERKRFQDLIGHIRMIQVRARTKNTLHEDILDRINDAAAAEKFLKDELPSYVHSFEFLLQNDDVSTRNLVEIGRRAAFKDWEAPALYIAKNKDLLPNFKQWLCYR